MSRHVTEFLPLLKQRIDKLQAKMAGDGEMYAIVAEARVNEAKFILEFLRLWDSVEIDASVFCEQKTLDPDQTASAGMHFCIERGCDCSGRTR